MLMGVRLDRKQVKWKIKPGIKDKYRTDRHHIFQYDWMVKFQSISNPAINIDFFYSNSYDSYQVCYSFHGVTTHTIMVNYENMSQSFFIDLCCMIIPLKANIRSAL